PMKLDLADVALQSDAVKTVEMGLLQKVGAQARPGDVVIHIHSSHGMDLADGTPCIVCADIALRGNDWDPATYISHQEIHGYILGLPPGVFFEGLYDACYSENMERLMEMGRTYGRSKYLPHPFNMSLNAA